MQTEMLNMNSMENLDRGKRPYRTPRLDQYGSLNRLTESTSGGMTTDSGGMGKSGS